MLLRQEVLYDVAEALQSDTQAVECDMGATPEGEVMQSVCFGPTLEGEVFEQGASRSHSGRSARQGDDPSLPLLAIEVLYCQGSLLLEMRFTAGEKLQ